MPYLIFLKWHLYILRHLRAVGGLPIRSIFIWKSKLSQILENFLWKVLCYRLWFLGILVVPGLLELSIDIPVLVNLYAHFFFISHIVAGSLDLFLYFYIPGYSDPVCKLLLMFIDLQICSRFIGVRAFFEKANMYKEVFTWAVDPMKKKDRKI